MRTIAALAAAVGISVAWWAAPVASAESRVLPERPNDAGVVFVDNPSLVDPHPMTAEAWSRVDGDRAVTVHFTTGTPECYGVHATVVETPDDVTVALTGGTLPEAIGRACIMIAVAGTAEVPLQSPLGDRQVLSET
jgi:hypothetical protein